MPVRLIHHIDRDRNARREHFCRVPPVAWDKQQFPGLEYKGRRHGLSKEREAFEIRLVHAIDPRKVFLLGCRIKVSFLLRRIEHELFPPVHLHEEGVDRRPVIVKDRE